MAHVVQPSNQTTHIDPYSQRLFDMGVEDSRVYLSRQVNYLLEILGSDCVVRGLEVEYSISGNIVSFTVTPGRAIVDTTLHLFNNSTLLDIDTTPYSDNGYLVVNISYRYIQTLQANRPFIKVSWVSPNPGTTQLPEPWSPARDRLVLCWFEFQKDSSNNLISITPHCSPSEYIVIDNITYYPRRGTDLDNGWGSVFNELSCYLPPISGGTFFDSEDQYHCTLDGGSF